MAEMQKLAKEQNKTLTNSDIMQLVKDTNLQLYTAKDLLNHLKNEYQKGSKLLSKDGLQNYIQDYEKFIKN